MVRLLALFAGVQVAQAKWGWRYDFGTPRTDQQSGPSAGDHAAALGALDLNALEHDLTDMFFEKSNSHWPADFGNYAPFFIRLAWHCSGTYRSIDGKGGCGGGRQRFEPERSWDDNAHLDKARALLAPIKRKYGDALSWGDLMTFAGTTALRSMGAPIEKHCVGRMDDEDGANSVALDPVDCEIPGHCPSPSGTGTKGLIYVNPEGPVLEKGGSPIPDPALSAKDIRDVFARMGDGDRDTVALIGGGHAFGKSHGACNVPGAGGVSPAEAFAAGRTRAWQGQCGSGANKGIGENTVTSGFEGPWTTTPTQWSNEYFRWLLDFEWERFIGPGGHNQWRIKNATGDQEGLLRLTADMALIYDDNYRALVQEFASDIDVLGKAFSDAWFRLTHRGGQWSDASRCDHGRVPSWVLDQNNNYMLESDSVLV